MMRRRVRSIAGVLILAVTLCGAALGPGWAGPAGVTLAYVAVTGHNLPLWIGGDERIFDRQGLNARILYLQSSVVATAALMSGNVDIVQETPAVPDSPAPRAQEIQVALSLEPEGKGRNPADFFDPKPLEQAIRELGHGP